jgi:hypothetical protein
MDEELERPALYYLDESDPDIVVLRRQDGTFVAAFSADGATREGIVEAAKEDHWALARTHFGDKGKKEGQSPTARTPARS